MRERPDDPAGRQLVEQLRCTVERARLLGLEPDNLPLYHLTRQQLETAEAQSRTNGDEQ